MIECDGGQHYTIKGLEADRIRDEALAQLGLTVLRYDNGQVMGDMDRVVMQIYQFLEHSFREESSKSPF